MTPATMRVRDLVPGDVVWREEMPGVEAIFVARTDHPLFRSLQLVVWRMNDGTWSHDALDVDQEVGSVTLTTPEERLASLRRALLHSSQWTAPADR
jgi:hypothetical protein